ncbi:MAG: nucleoside-diphosphate kinase [Bacteroidetes bacterium]|nr:nucleoside-diphosphate kinase [Bacteroidota bacterium]
MKNNVTFTIVKPLALKMNYLGPILTKITENNFKIIALKMHYFSKEQACSFYGIHQGKPFFDGLIDFITSGPVVVAVLEKENAVEDYRTLIGSTNPAVAADGTIRKLYGIDIQQNAVHGSDSNENALIEAKFFFSDLEFFNY